jgi:hypothetical protein
MDQNKQNSDKKQPQDEQKPKQPKNKSENVEFSEINKIIDKPKDKENGKAKEKLAASLGASKFLEY